jgi:DNA modification methylase
MAMKDHFQTSLRLEPALAAPAKKRSLKARRRANELDGATWTRYSISIWREIKKTQEEIQLGHPALFPVALVTRLIECFAASDDRVVLDPFMGVGSTVIAAEALGKIGIGIDVSEDFVEKARRRPRLLTGKPNGQRIIHCDDANHLLKYAEPDTVDLVITSPPYWDILLQRRTADYKEVRHYGGAERDLGKIRTYHSFLYALQRVFKLVYTVLKPGKYCCVVVMDIRKKDRLYPFHADLTNYMEQLGFRLEDIIIWDRGHEYSNLRPLGYPSVFRVNKVHEYILIFRKPATVAGALA